MSSPGVTLQEFNSHADFENNCALCHQPLATEQASLCQECHTDVRSQLEQKIGTHGRLKKVEQCSACHGEHKGREFDPVQTALDTFNHNQTPFPLTGKHAQSECADCHKESIYGGTKSDCAACHIEPALHKGMFGLDCAKCHTDTAWKPGQIKGLAFDHSQANFSMVRHTTGYDNQPLACTTCHNGPTEKFDQQTCAACHTRHPPAAQPAAIDFLTKHVETYGADCLQCHDGADRMRGFKHEQVFPLTGKHSTVTCDTCHAEKKFRSTSGQCIACHAEPEIHLHFFGLKCEYCHASDAWQPALLHAHNFPLDHGGQGEVACETCHTERYAIHTCYGCHDHTAEGIRNSHKKVELPQGITLDDCATCHLDGK